MSPTILGSLGIAALLFLIFMRIPVGIALGLVATVGMATMIGFAPTLSLIGNESYEFVNNWTLTAIPMFILMGELAHQARFTEGLYSVARVLLRKIPGGLAISTNIASAGFAAASGSSMAMAGAMSRLAIPEMLAARYNKGLAAGAVASAGTLGALIPPSIPFILYGSFMETSVGKLLMAGLIPGLLTLFAYSLLIFLRCLKNPALAPSPEDDTAPLTLRESALAILPLSVVVAIVVGGLYSGMVSATEVGAFGSAAVLLMALITRSLSLERFLISLELTLEMTASIFLIAVGAILFSKFITLTQIPASLGTWIDSANLSIAWFLLLVVVVYLIGGMLLDPLGLMLVTLPVFTPMLMVLNVDLIWFGVIIVKLIEIGMLTPPVGLNLFVVSAAVGDQIDFETIVKGILWFLIPDAFVLLAIVMFPTLSLLVPNSMF